MRNQTKPLRALMVSAVGIAAASLSFGAHADLANGIVDVWNVNVAAVFDLTNGTVCSTASCNNTTNNITETATKLSWGSGTSGPSSLTISDTPAIANVITNGPKVANISITHDNKPIDGDTLTSANIISTLTLTPVVPALSGLLPVPFVFKIHFKETDNDPRPGLCADGGVYGSGVNINGCADIYVTDANSLNFSFFYDMDGAGSKPNKEYFISFFELTTGLNPLPTAACAAAGQPAPCLGFRTPELAKTTVQFASLITTEKISIPEPATSALLGIGLLGGLLARRRRS